VTQHTEFMKHRQDLKYRLDGRTRSMLLLLEDRRDDSE